MPPYHPISLNKAAGLISAFLKQSALGTIAKDIALGGLIDLDIPDKDISGWTFWYCWNPDENSFPKFFMAYEPNVWTDESPEDMYFKSDNLLMPYPGYIFRYPKTSGTNVDDVLDFLAEQRKEWGSTKTNDPQINYEDVEIFTSNFMDPFPAEDPNPFCDYPIAYFVGSEIKEFAEQGDYVRYFFGLDTTSEVNQIRLILISVDVNGRNQIGPGFVMFEQSWPPEA
jgi:hypothetical protein